MNTGVRMGTSAETRVGSGAVMRLTCEVDIESSEVVILSENEVFIII